MKKNLILSAFLVGIFAVSLVSAGWFGDFFGRVTSTGNVVNRAGIPVNMDTLSEGISLSKGSNYYFIWNGEDTSMDEVAGSLEGSLRHIREMPSSRNGRRNRYWYSKGSFKNSVTSFKGGEKYLIYMSKDSVWKIEDEKIIKSDFGVLKYVEGKNYESNNCFFVKNCVRLDTTHEYVKEGNKIAEVRTYVEKYSSENFKDVYEIVNRMMEDPENKYNLVQGHFIPNKKYYQMDFIKYSDGSEVHKAFIWRTEESIVMIVIETEDMNENLLDSFTRLLDKYLEKHSSILPENSPAPVTKDPNRPEEDISEKKFPIKECSPLVFAESSINWTMNGNEACRRIGKHCLIVENRGRFYKILSGEPRTPSGEPNIVSSVHASCEKEFVRGLEEFRVGLDKALQINSPPNQTSWSMIMEPEVHVICCLPN